MKSKLCVSIGQFSDKGRKPCNQDSMGVHVPIDPQLSSKGVAVAIADGISTSDVSQIASEMAVRNFLQDYYCTSDAWSVKTSAERVIRAANSWLYAQTQSGPHRFNKDKGFICTFSALVLKAHSAYLFHCGDTRIFRKSGNTLECLTVDHRHRVDAETEYLTRALGMNPNVELDFKQESTEVGDIFVLATDGVYEYLKPETIAHCINHEQDLNSAAQTLVELAFNEGSKDNLSIQILRIDQLPEATTQEVALRAHDLPLPPPISARMEFDGLKVEREIYISSRSHVFLCTDLKTQEELVLKVPAMEQKHNFQYLERFLLEDWIAKKLDNAHVLKAARLDYQAQYLYLCTEYIEGQTLSQWMLDNPKPSLEAVRSIIEQVAQGLQAFHRQEMIHQDLRPANIMINARGTVKIIDFGSTLVAGLNEIKSDSSILGTAQYSAPEYFIGQLPSTRADIFSLGVICYQMFSGALPYGNHVARAVTPRAQGKLTYTSLNQHRPDLPSWLDQALQKSLAVAPHKRYQVLSEFIYDLRHPNPQLNKQHPKPLLEKNPVLFWQCTSLILLLLLLWQLSAK